MKYEKPAEVDEPHRKTVVSKKPVAKHEKPLDSRKHDNPVEVDKLVVSKKSADKHESSL
jgi:hypothetical protein